jgi:hypothetical protein
MARAGSAKREESLKRRGAEKSSDRAAFKVAGGKKKGRIKKIGSYMTRKGRHKR